MMKDVSTPHTQHLYPYRWSLEDAVFTKDKGKVFSCFACGGGSTMGYKIAGYDVIGCNEIDPRMMKCYVDHFLANQTLWPREYNVCYVYDSYILSAVNSP